MAEKMGTGLGAGSLLQRCMPQGQTSHQGMITCLVIHAAATWCLVGLIWIIQVVHYPLFKDVGRGGFVSYHERHMALISWVVGPLMLAEVGSAVLLLLLGERSLLFFVSIAPLAMVWLSTVLLQVPLHQRLAHGYDSAAINRLVSTNGWRTFGWTVRGICVVLLLVQKIR
jgi:hypothetical protein